LALGVAGVGLATDRSLVFASECELSLVLGVGFGFGSVSLDASWSEVDCDAEINMRK
jgi:hypothetical protein